MSTFNTEELHIFHLIKHVNCHAKLHKTRFYIIFTWKFYNVGLIKERKMLGVRQAVAATYDMLHRLTAKI